MFWPNISGPFLAFEGNCLSLKLWLTPSLLLCYQPFVCVNILHAIDFQKLLLLTLGLIFIVVWPSRGQQPTLTWKFNDGAVDSTTMRIGQLQLESLNHKITTPHPKGRRMNFWRSFKQPIDPSDPLPLGRSYCKKSKILALPRLAWPPSLPHSWHSGGFDDKNALMRLATFWRQKCVNYHFWEWLITFWVNAYCWIWSDDKNA